MQLVAYGAQDVYLTGNPQITFFKVVYRRHTNFACESIEQTFNGTVGYNKRVTATISRNGDLITNCYVQITLPELTGANDAYRNAVGHQIIKDVELEIGGQKIDKHYADWLEIWSELTVPASKQAGYKQMVGKYDTVASSSSAATLFVPLIFFFNRNPGLALPLIALQYHEVKLNFEFASLSDCIYNTASGTIADTTKSFDASLYVDYIYLDTEERRRFAQVSHEMLIEQLQFTGDEAVTGGVNNRVRLNFNHPVKELVWVIKDETIEASDPFNYSQGPESGNVVGQHPMVSAKIQLNGHDRFSQRTAEYFRLVQPYQHHTNVPNRAIYCYSFALKPEEHQPSGTCNFSRIDNATLSLNCADGVAAGSVLKVYAVNYNVLRIMSGMGGLAYSN